MVIDVEKTAKIGNFTIDGIVTFDDTKNIDVTFHNMWVRMEGELLVGTKDKPR